MFPNLLKLSFLTTDSVFFFSERAPRINFLMTTEVSKLLMKKEKLKKSFVIYFSFLVE